jgi:phage terminase small subunit
MATRGELTPKQAVFVSEYLVDLCGSAAAKRAGYSPKSAGRFAQELLAKPHIQAAIAEAMRARESRTLITQDRVLEEFARIAFLDPRRLFDDEGRPIPLPKLDADVAAAIVGLDVATIGNAEVGVGQVQKIKIADKIQSLTQLGRHLGMFNDKLKLGGDAENPLQMTFYIPDNGRDPAK